MIKKITMMLALVALMAAPAFASVQNVKVGGDLATTSILRDGFDFNNGRQNEIAAQTRLKVSADMTDNVSSTISLTNEKLWGDSTASAVNLEAAYVTMKELLYSSLTVTVGRQPLAYGNQLIVGNSSGSAFAQPIGDLLYATGFDAVKAVLSYDALTVDVFAARVNNGVPNTVDNNINGTHDNQNLYGINANYKFGDKMSTVVEGYTFARMNDNVLKSENTYVPGLRVSTNPIEGLNLQLEGAYQFGTINNANVLADQMTDRRHAYAIQGGANYALPVLKDMKPVVGAQYTLLSGNKAENGPDVHKEGKAWDPMFENQNSGRIFDAVIVNSNRQLSTLSLEVTPINDLTAKASWNALWLAQKQNYVSGSANSNKYLGSEADLDLTYAYTEDVKFGVSAGYFATGKNFLVGSTGNNNASQLLSSVSVAF